MIIIAESGATKTDWRSISDNGTIYSLRTPGMNVASATPEFISGVLASAIPELDPSGDCHRNTFLCGRTDFGW